MSKNVNFPLERTAKTRSSYTCGNNIENSKSFAPVECLSAYTIFDDS